MVVFFAVSMALATLPIWLLIRAIQQGVVSGRGLSVRRSDSPFGFWFGIVGYGVGAIMMLIAPLWFALK